MTNLEIWKDIPGYEGRYQASTYGRIRSVDREITQLGRGGQPFTRRLKGRILRPAATKKKGPAFIRRARSRRARLNRS